MPKGQPWPDSLLYVKSSAQTAGLAAKLTELTKPYNEIGESLLASATYDGDKRKAILKFYDQKAGRFWLWEDNTGHRPYCVEGDTLLLGDNKTIAGTREGDHILGMTGEVLVEARTTRLFEGEMIRVYASGLLPFWITPEHPVLAARFAGHGSAKITKFDGPRWVLPSRLRPKLQGAGGDYLVMPIAKSRFSTEAIPLAPYSKMRSGWLKVAEFPLTEEAAWLIGVYVAEGSPGGRRGAVFSLNEGEVALWDKIKKTAGDLGFGCYKVRNGRHSVNVHIAGAVLSRALAEWCGKGAGNKRIPDFILFHSNLRLLKALIEGYTAGDGSTGITTREKSISKSQLMCTTSKLLALQLQQAYARLGIFAGIKIQHGEGEYVIEGRIVHQKEAYTIGFVQQPKHTRSRRVGESFYLPIRRVEKAMRSCNVYNVQTSDGTYLVSNAVVHNCYTRLEMGELEAVRKRKDVIEIVEEEKADLLNDTKARLRKIVTTDPLAIGGGNDSIRDMIKAWEADIKYYENFAYDRGLRMGTYYRVSKGKIIQVKHEVPDKVNRSLEEVTRRNPKEFQPYLRDWAELLSEPLVEFKRIALDIEVDNEAGRLPDPNDPKQPVIAVSFFNEGERVVYLLKGEKETKGLDGNPFSYQVFDDEADMLRAVFSKIMDYPVIVTFNGDDFDLRYLQHRAEQLQIREEENPIQLERVAASLKHGIHIDLYQFFRNRSIQVYAFANKYAEHTLNAIAETLLNKSKIEYEGEIGELPLAELAEYCLNDSQLTYELTSMMGSVVMKLLLVISRIGKMPMNDVSRLGVSNWIRSLLFFEHRKIGALIPRQDELSEKGGASSQAIIKGKKYKGGLVIEPKPGVYFDVSVLDFASLLYDESIFVRKRQTGQVYKTKIGEFVERELPSGPGFAAKEIDPTWDVLSFDYEGQQAAWKTVTAVIRHPSQSDVLEVETESGRRVKITKGHSVITLDPEGKKKTVRGSDLKPGDYVVALSSLLTQQRDTSLDLLPYLRRLHGYKITRGGGGHGEGVVLTARGSHRESFIQRYLPLTSDLMWGLGYWVAEGWPAVNRHGGSLRAEASSDDIEFAQSRFNAAGFRTWTSDSKTSGCSNLGVGGRYNDGVCVLPGKILVRLVRKWFGSRARAKRVPDWVLQLPLQTRESFIDGYYRGDGYDSSGYGQLAKNGKHKVGSYSKTLVNDLTSLGLVSGFHCISKNLDDPESFLTWSDGPWAYRKTKRPPPELLARSEHVQTFAETAYYASHRRQPIRYERVSRTSVAAYKLQFRRFYKGNCHFEKVKQITEVKNNLPVYDISVRGSESFFNGDGILVSNSLYPSLIKVHNLSYETVNCPHPECRSNTIPETSSWACTWRKGIVSLVTGSLRDLRVAHYKPLTKDQTLSKDDRDLYNVVSQGLKVFLNACFSGDTYIVTPLGIKNIKEMKVGDEVVNVNPRTLKAEIDRVVEVQAFPYNGDLIHFKDARFVDLMVTPNHRFLTVDHRKSSQSQTVFRTAEEVCNLTNMKIPKLRGGVEDVVSPSRISLLETAKLVAANANFYPESRTRLINWFRSLPAEQQRKIREYGSVCKYWSQKRQRLESHYRMPAVYLTEEDIDAVEAVGGSVLVGEFQSAKIPIRFDAIDFASLCGWFVSEGSPHLNEPKVYANGNYRGRAASITISQGQGKGNPRGVEFRGEIRDLLDRLGLPYVQDRADIKYFQITSSVLYEWMVTHCYAKGSETHDASTKTVPRFVFGSAGVMKSFLDSVYKGDGNRRGTRYSTSSVKLAQDLVVLTTMLGMKAKMNYDGEIFRVVFKNVSSKLTHSGNHRTKHVEKVPFDGMVYCVTTETNHTVIAGRNGKFAHVGQSYGVLGFETFAFYCLPVAEATAALGRDAITRTIAKCNELGIKVLYGDTDSTYLQNPSKEQIETITRWTRNELGIELDLDKVYRYVAFSSRKKNYFGVFPDGTVDIKGLTGKKSQTPEYLKKVFYETLGVLSSVKTPEDFERARTSTRDLLAKMISDLKGKKVPVTDLAFTVMMGKPTGKYNGTTPQHVRAAMQLEEKGKEIKAGEIIAYVKTKNPPYVKPAELARADEIDADKYIEYARSMFDQLLDALDFSFDEIMGGTTLDLFWST